jgi:hypothetical protein
MGVSILLAREPLLSAQEEVALAPAIEAGQAAERRLSDGGISFPRDYLTLLITVKLNYPLFCWY